MMKKFSFLFLPFFFLSALISCQKPDPEVSIDKEKEVSVPKEESMVEDLPVVEALPAVVLRDDASVWGNEDGALSASPISRLDMGTEVLYLGVDEKLSAGNKNYDYSKIQLKDGSSGWISTTRLAKNSVAGVVVEESGLYGKPIITAPLSRFIPAGQIVAISLEKGNVGGFAEISFSYYDGDRLSNPETVYVNYDALSVSSNDLDAARLVLKAFRNPEQSDDFFKLAFSLGSIFDTYAGFKQSNKVYTETNLDSESIMTTDEIKLLAINPLDKGEAMPWYLGQLGDNSLVWVYSHSVVISPELSQKLTDKAILKDNTNYNGTGTPSVNLFQDLALRQKLIDDQGNEKLVPKSSLEAGEVVYSHDDIFTFDGIDFLSLDFPNGETGWASKSYIAVDAKPAVITEDEIPVFTEPKLTALSKLKLNKFQVVAIYSEKVSDFYKVSYISQEDDSLQKEVYIRSANASFSTKGDDVNAALLLSKVRNAKTPDLVELYLKKTAELNSFFKDSLGDIYYGDIAPAPGDMTEE